EKSLLQERQQRVERHVPNSVIEDFDLDGTDISSALHIGADSTQLDDAVAHDTAIHQHVSGGDEPVGNVKSDDSTRRARELVTQIWIPPDVVDVGDHANRRVVESLRQFSCFAESRYARALGGE